MSAPEGQGAGGSAPPTFNPSRQGTTKQGEHLPLKPSLSRRPVCPPPHRQRDGLKAELCPGPARPSRGRR